MMIKKIDDKKNTVQVITIDNQETLFSLMKVYLTENSNVNVCGVFKEHHLIDETSLFLKTKKDDAKATLKKELAKIRKDLNSLKIK